MKFKDIIKNNPFYGVSEIIYDYLNTKFRLTINKDRLEKLKKIYVGIDSKEIEREYFSKIITSVTLILICILLLIPICIVSSGGKKILYNDYFIEKEDVGGSEKSVNIRTKINGEEKDVTVDIPAKEYSDKELKKKIDEAQRYIDKNYLGENESADKITKNLNFVKSIPNSAIEIIWNGDSEEYIDDNGKLNRDGLKSEKQLEIGVTLKYKDYKKELFYQLTVIPPQKSQQDLIWDKWKEMLGIAKDNTSDQKYLMLPKEVMGHSVHYSEKRDKSIACVLLCGVLCIISVPFVMDSQMKSSIEKRDKELRKEYPELIEKFILLIGAGLGVRGAWNRMTDEYLDRLDKDNKKSYAYEEMLVTRHNIENGMSEIKAYELFGRRIGLLPYMKFSTLITQNLRKGTSDMLRILEYEAVDVMNEKKENARILGEEASTKLLFPMMIMMVEVFAIIIYAAFQSM